MAACAAQVTRYAGEGDPRLAQQRMSELFDNIMLNEDVSHLWSSSSARSAQAFAPWNGRLVEVQRDEAGEMRMGASPVIYTNRRGFSGAGWAIELHSVRLAANPKRPERRYGLEIAVLNRLDREGRFTVLLEYGAPATMARQQDYNTGYAPSAPKL